MTGNKNMRVGLLVDVTAEYFTARLVAPEEGDASGQLLTGSKTSIGQVGSYLLIRQAELQTVTMVERSYRASDGKGGAAHMARLTPLGEIDRRGKFNRGISRFPNSGDEIHLA